MSPPLCIFLSYDVASILSLTQLPGLTRGLALAPCGAATAGSVIAAWSDRGELRFASSTTGFGTFCGTAASPAELENGASSDLQVYAAPCSPRGDVQASIDQVRMFPQ